MMPRWTLACLAVAVCLAAMMVASARAASAAEPVPHQPANAPPSLPGGGHDLDENNDMRRDGDPSWRRLGAFATFSPLTAAEEEKRFGSTTGTNTVTAPGLVPSADLPAWRLGDKFIYDDGGWEQLIAIEGDTLRFINQDGEIFQRAPDFTLPARRIDKPDGEVRESQILPAGAKETGELSLWPLAAGKASAFIETGTARLDADKTGGKTAAYRTLWRCQAMAAVAKTVAAGAYDSQRIVCRRLGKDDREILEESRWDYAPAIQYWLGREARLPEGRRLSQHLAAIFPGLDQFAADENEAREIRQQWQDSLAATPQGETDLWLAADGSRSVAMTPGPAFRRQDGSLCRRYSQRLQAPAFDRIYPGMACENPAGVWQTPRQ